MSSSLLGCHTTQETAANHIPFLLCFWFVFGFFAVFWTDQSHTSKVLMTWRHLKKLSIIKQLSRENEDVWSDGSGTTEKKMSVKAPYASRVRRRANKKYIYIEITWIAFQCGVGARFRRPHNLPGSENLYQFWKLISNSWPYLIINEFEKCLSAREVDITWCQCS